MDDDSDEMVKKTGEVKEDDFIGASVAHGRPHFSSRQLALPSGAAELHFDNAPAAKKWKLDQWVDIVDEKAKAAGKMHIIVRWVPPGQALKR